MKELRMAQPLTQQEILNLQEATSEAEWNHVVDSIKAQRGGQYPSDWWAVGMSHIAEQKPFLGLHISTLPTD